MPAPNRKRHLRSRLVSPNRCLNARYDIIHPSRPKASLRALGFLAPRTKMRGPSRQTNALDGPAAARARHPGSAVNTKLLLKFPLAAGGTDVIANAGATLIDGTVQNRNDGLTQTLSLPGCRILSELAGMQARFEQRFIRINIANAGYHALIQQD